MHGLRLVDLRNGILTYQIFLIAGEALSIAQEGRNPERLSQMRMEDTALVVRKALSIAQEGRDPERVR